MPLVTRLSATGRFGVTTETRRRFPRQPVVPGGINFYCSLVSRQLPSGIEIMSPETLDARENFVGFRQNLLYQQLFFIFSVHSA